MTIYGIFHNFLEFSIILEHSRNKFLESCIRVEFIRLKFHEFCRLKKIIWETFIYHLTFIHSPSFTFLSFHVCSAKLQKNTKNEKWNFKFHFSRLKSSTRLHIFEPFLYITEQHWSLKNGSIFQFLTHGGIYVVNFTAALLTYYLYFNFIIAIINLKYKTFKSKIVCESYLMYPFIS